MKVKLVEVAYTFHVPIPRSRDWDQVVIHAGLHHNKLYLSFSIGGTDQDRGILPATLVEGIQRGLDYAGNHIRVQDLVEIDPVPEDDNSR